MKEAQDISSADRVTLWIIDKNYVQGQTIENEGWKDLGKIPIDRKSIVGETALSRAILNVPCDLYKDLERSKTARIFDKRNRYRTCSLLCIPIFDSEDMKLVGVLQLINKVRNNQLMSYVYEEYPNPEVVPDCFRASFNHTDEQQIVEFGRTVGTVLRYMSLEDEFKKRSQDWQD
jgi:adenylate cyclase